MSEQPKALRLADELDAGQNFYAESSISFDFKLSNAASEAAAELRRLHALNAELLEALQTVVANAPDPYCAITRAVDAQCRAAIANATGER